jgi:hypothetical protein
MAIGFSLFKHFSWQVVLLVIAPNAGSERMLVLVVVFRQYANQTNTRSNEGPTNTSNRQSIDDDA